MAKFECSHYECSSDSLDIMIYGIDVKEVFPEYYAEIPDRKYIEDKIPSIVHKSNNSKYETKAIMLYAKPKELLHRKYVILFYYPITVFCKSYDNQLT